VEKVSGIRFISGRWDDMRCGNWYIKGVNNPIIKWEGEQLWKKPSSVLLCVVLCAWGEALVEVVYYQLSDDCDNLLNKWTVNFNYVGKMCENIGIGC